MVTIVEWMDELQQNPTRSDYCEVVRLQNAEPMKTSSCRKKRKLAETDWVVTMHKELGTNIPTAMKTYRAALRDITDSATSLDDVTWPEKP